MAILLGSTLLIPPVRTLLFLSKGDIDAYFANKDAVLDDYRSALNADPDNETALLKCGLVYRDAGRNDEAYESFKKLYGHPTQKFAAIPYLVSLSLKRHAANEALQYATEWIEHDANSAEAYDARGLAYEQLEKFDLALDDFNKSVQLNPSGSASEDRDDVLQKQREWKRMTQGIFDPKLEDKPEDYDALVRNARKLFRGYSWAQGEEMATKAIKLDPNRPQAYYVRAAIHREANRDAQALVDELAVLKYSRAKPFVMPKLEDEPVDQGFTRCHVPPSRVNFYVASSYYALKQFKEAFRYVNEALSMPPDAPYFVCREYELRYPLDLKFGNSKQAQEDGVKAAASRAKVPAQPESQGGVVMPDWF
ncbi:MAG TPA: tetratricopeptide repeat protein [Planktothrix sp.]